MGKERARKWNRYKDQNKELGDIFLDLTIDLSEAAKLTFHLLPRQSRQPVSACLQCHRVKNRTKSERSRKGAPDTTGTVFNDRPVFWEHFSAYMQLSNSARQMLITAAKIY